MLLRWKTIITTLTLTVIIIHNVINNHVYCTDTGNLKSPSTYTSSISRTPDPGGGNNGSELSENNSHKQSDIQETVIVSQALQQSLTKINLIGLGSDNNPKPINSDEYDLVNHKNSLFKFMFKPDIKLVEVRYEGHTLWTHDPQIHGSDYPLEISLSSDELNIKIKNYSLYYKIINDKWILSEKVIFDTTLQKYTVLTLDLDSDSDTSVTDSTTSSVVESSESSIKCKVNDTSKYDLIKYPNGSFMFIFNDGAKCIGLKHDKLTVWKHDPNKHQTKFPNSIYCKADGSVYVYFDPYYFVYHLDTETNQWTLNSKLSYKPKGLINPSEHPKCFTIVTLESDTSVSDTSTTSKENDCSQYDVYQNFDHMYLYVFKSGARCTEFKFKGRTIWSHDPKEHKDKHQTKYPLSISIDLADFTFDFGFGKDTLRYRLTDSGLIYYTFSNYLTSYPSDSKPLFETTSVQEQKDSSQFTKVKKEVPKDSLDNDLNTRDSKTTVDDVKDTELVKPSKTTILSQPKAKTTESDTSTTSTEVLDDKQLISTVPYLKEPIESVTLASIPSQHKPEDSLDVKDSDNQDNQKEKKIETVQLDINSKKSTDEYDYSQSVNIDIYLPKPGYAFNKVTSGNKKIWECDASNDSTKFAKKVVIYLIDLSNSTITITLYDGTRKNYKLTNKSNSYTDLRGSQQVDHKIGVDDQKEKKIETVQLDIKSKKSCNQYTYTESNKIGTFEPKKCYGFNKVTSGNTEIWSTTDSSQYATKVVVQGIGSDKNTVTLALSDGIIKIYHKQDKNKPWTDSSPNKQPNTSVEQHNKSNKETNLFPLKKPINISTNQPKKVNRSSKQTTSSSSNWLKYLFCCFSCCSSDCCNSDSSSDKVVIKEAPTHKFRTVVLTLLALGIHKHNDNQESLIPVKLDIKSKSSTDEYTYKEENKIHTYQTKPNYGFDKIIVSSSYGCLKSINCCYGFCSSDCCSDDVIWESEGSNYTKYATIVVVDESGSDKTLALRLSDGTIKIYELIMKWD